jgi:hypothetical protein
MLYLLIAGVSLGAQRSNQLAPYCTPQGKAPGVACSYNGQTCIELHPDLCVSDEPVPNCCNASPESQDRNAKACHCCGSQK